MRASLMYGAGDVRVETVPDSAVKLPTDALVRVTASCVCGSDLWPYASRPPADDPARMGHEFIGVVEDIGSEVATLARGDLVVSPFAISDGRCGFCREGLQTSCTHPQAGFWDEQPLEGAQAEGNRVPLADGTLVKLPVGSHVVLEAVGTLPAYRQALGIVRPGGTISRVGVPQYEDAPIGWDSLFRHNIRLAGRPGAGPRVHGGADAGHHGGRHRAREGVRRGHRPRWRPVRVPGHGRPHEPEGSDQALSAAGRSRPVRRRSASGPRTRAGCYRGRGTPRWRRARSAGGGCRCGRC